MKKFDNEEREEIPIEITEFPQEGNLPVLYINCKLDRDFTTESQRAYLNKIRDAFREKLPNHYIIIGNQELQFAYITPKQAFYTELRQNHCITTIDK